MPRHPAARARPCRSPATPLVPQREHHAGRAAGGALRAAHRQRLLAPGARLPSVRECARRHGVSPHTVVAAYDQLLARGLVEARPPARLLRARAPARRTAARPPSRRRGAARARRRATRCRCSATALIRGMFQPPGAHADARPGHAARRLARLPAARHARCAGSARHAARRRLSLHYGDPAGELRAARGAVARKLADLGVRGRAAADRHHRRRHARAGRRHAARLLRAGDSVLVDEPGWSVEYARLAALGHARAAGAARRGRARPGGDGAPDRGAAAAQRPRLYVTVSVLHNPTGASLSLQARAPPAAAGAGARAARSSRTTPTPTWRRRTCRALAAARRAASARSTSRGFSKILAPNWRVGFMAAPPALVERLVDTKLLTTPDHAGR